MNGQDWSCPNVLKKLWWPESLAFLAMCRFGSDLERRLGRGYSTGIPRMQLALSYQPSSIRLETVDERAKDSPAFRLENVR
jgi:hypothetical protein